MLLSHGWAGNVRELQNVIQRASLLCEGNVITGHLLAGWLGPASSGEPSSGDPIAPRTDPIADLIGRTEREVIDALLVQTLRACDDNRTKAAEMLGIGVRTLFNRLRTKEPARL